MVIAGSHVDCTIHTQWKNSEMLSTSFYTRVPVLYQKTRFNLSLCEEESSFLQWSDHSRKLISLLFAAHKTITPETRGEVSRSSCFSCFPSMESG